MDRAIGATRQRFAQHLCRASRTGRDHDHFPAVLFLQSQRLFERIRVRLVQLEAGVLITDPGLAFVDAELPLAGHDLFDADSDLHGLVTSSQLAAPSWKLVTGNYSLNLLNRSAA